jgi:hypothetical protein
MLVGVSKTTLFETTKINPLKTLKIQSIINSIGVKN